MRATILTGLALAMLITVHGGSAHAQPSPLTLEEAKLELSSLGFDVTEGRTADGDPWLAYRTGRSQPETRVTLLACDAAGCRRAAFLQERSGACTSERCREARAALGGVPVRRLTTPDLAQLNSAGSPVSVRLQEGEDVQHIILERTWSPGPDQGFGQAALEFDAQRYDLGRRLDSLLQPGDSPDE